MSIKHEIDVDLIVESKDPPASKPASVGENYRKAVNTSRDVIKWIIGGFGAVGAILAGSIPIAALAGADVENGVVAAVGGVLAYLGIAIVLVAGLAATSPAEISNADLKDPKLKSGGGLEGRRYSSWLRYVHWPWLLGWELSRNKAYLLPDGVDSIKDLNSAIDKDLPDDIASKRKKLGRAGIDPTGVAAIKGELARTGAKLTAFRRRRAQLRWKGRYLHAQVAMFRAAIAIVLGAALVGLGVSLVLVNVQDRNRDKVVAETAKLTQETNLLSVKSGAEVDKLIAETALTYSQIVVAEDDDGTEPAPLPPYSATLELTDAALELHQFQCLEAPASIEVFVLAKDPGSEIQVVLPFAGATCSRSKPLVVTATIGAVTPTS